MRKRIDTLKSSLRDEVLIACYFAVGMRNKSLPILRRGLRDRRLTERSLAEVFLHLSLLLGFPTMLEGLAMLRSVMGDAKTSHTNKLSDKDRFARGTTVLKRVYGRMYDRLLANLKSVHPELPELITRDVYGRIISRPGLSLKDREVINVAVLTIQELHEQLYSHIRGALRLGVSAKNIERVILMSSRIGGTDPARSLSMLSKLIASRGQTV